jgi:hypothetical protein
VPERCIADSGFFILKKTASVTSRAITAVTFTHFDTPRSLYLMRQSAAVLCQDDRSLQTLQATLDPLEIDLMNCHSGQSALELIMTGKCTTLIVDCDLDGAEKIIRMANLLPPEQKPALLAVSSRAWPGTGQAFQSAPAFCTSQLIPNS